MIYTKDYLLEPPPYPVKFPPPCKICGASEVYVGRDTWKIEHLYELHDIPRPGTKKP